MPKRVISFKPTPECEQQLAELMERWKCDRTFALSTAVAMAYSGNGLGIPKGYEMTPTGLNRDIPTATHERFRPDSSRIDRDKIAAFQRKAGMGGAGKR